MKTGNKVGFGVAGLIIFALGLAWLGHVSNDDPLFQFGILSVFLLSLVNGAILVGRLRDRDHS